MGNEQGRSGRADPALQGISAMDQKMQEKFSKGIQFNSERLISHREHTAPAVWSGRATSAVFRVGAHDLRGSQAVAHLLCIAGIC